MYNSYNKNSVSVECQCQGGMQIQNVILSCSVKTCMNAYNI